MKRSWSALGSVKLAIFLIILIASASVLGTLVPRHRPAAEYAARFGAAGKIVVPLGLDGLYQSPGFIGLLILFSINVAVCTLQRFPSRLRNALGPGWSSESGRFEAWKTRDAWTRKGSPAEAATAAAEALRLGRYAVREANDGRRVLLRGTRHGFGAFGADIVHLGLIVVIAGGAVTGLASFRTDIVVTEGRTAPAGRNGLELRLDAFDTEYYPAGNVKDWKSAVTVVRDGRAVASGTIEVNRPLKAGGLMFYQSGYGRDWDNPVIGLRLRKKGDPNYGKDLSLRPGESADAGDGMTVAVVRFVPDFVLTAGNEVTTRSLQPENPAALVEIRKTGGAPESSWVFAKYPDFPHFKGAAGSGLTIELRDFDAPEYSVIQAASDPGATVIWAGCAIVMAGLFFSFYWPAREIRIALEPGPGNSTSIAAAGRSSKGRERLEKEFKQLTDRLRRPR